MPAVVLMTSALSASTACSGSDETAPGVGGTYGVGGTLGSGGTLGDGGTTTDCSGMVDECPMATGLTHGCRARFALGINYAWHEFSADFGGNATWNQGGISQNRETYAKELADMRAGGVTAVRWWMWPDFRGDGVEFDASGDPVGLSAMAITDIQEALALAEENDVYLVLTIFSFDNFRPDRLESGIEIPGMSPMVRDALRRLKLTENIVRPAAQTVATSPFAHRLLGWDIINEPEWAVAPTGLDDQDFEPNDEVDPITLDEMKALIEESAAVLHQELPAAQVSVGWAAAKWNWAFGDIVGLDFHQPHIYGWVNEWWPYTMSPAELGYEGKPTVMGEFYLMDMPFGADGDNSTFDQIVSSWYDNGYAGAWSWQYNENAASLPLVKAFAETKGCSASY